MEALKVKTIAGLASFVRPGIDTTIGAYRNILTINNFTLSSNLAITALFIASNPTNSTLNCLDTYYSPLEAKCLAICPYSYTIWPTSQTKYKYCLTSYEQNGWYSASNYTDNNLADMGKYLPNGCLKSVLTGGFAVICEVCRNGWEMVNGSCVCSYGYFMRNGMCYPCAGMECELNTNDQWVINQNDLSTVSITISLKLPDNEVYAQRATSTFEANVTVNHATRSVNATYDNSTNKIAV
jgi:hypothetical protein